MSDVTVGLLHPGEMGGAVGTCLRANRHRVLWVSGGRSAASVARATAARLEDAGTLERLVGESAIILSVCPPHAALDTARAVAAHRFSGVFVDANAVAPGTAREIERLVGEAGARFVDGGIVGPPPVTPGSTRLYLAGKEAAGVTALFESGALEAVDLARAPGAASALKMAYAAYTKGSSALLVSIRALAIHEGVDEALLREWAQSQPELPGRSDDAARRNARKAWRFVGEMEEMAASFAEAGLPDGFSRAAAEVYRRLAPYKDTAKPPSVDDVAASLLR
ncbi:MAG: DUF1932 domain-containing protein [Candidatus Rokubacteria bacterium]|nr:DUF1932 domain-containing protein [Candidatus Rokubacteria bacterium]